MGKKSGAWNTTEDTVIRALDTLAEFEEYTSEVMPLLRKAITEGWTAEQMSAHPKIKAALVARQLSIALNEKDSSKAMAALKDMRDRQEGKATERKDVKVSIENLGDNELDAKLKSLMAAESTGDSPDDDNLPPLAS